MKPILECRKLCFRYGSMIALCDVDFSVEPGGIVGLLGPNGSGKTTLIKLAMGMLQPERGEILIDGERPSPKTKAATAYLPDANYLCKWMRVEEQVKYFADFFEDFDRNRAESMLSRLGSARIRRSRPSRRAIRKNSGSSARCRETQSSLS